MNSILDLLRTHKIISFGAADILLAALGLILAFLLRFDGTIPSQYLPDFWFYIAVIAALNMFFLWRGRLYAFTWSFVGLSEMAQLLKALTLASAIFGLTVIVWHNTLFAGFPRSAIFISYILNLIFIGGLRISKRGVQDILRGGADVKAKTLIVGAGPEGEQIIRGLIAEKQSEYYPVGIVDNDISKHDTLIHGIKVLGAIDDMPELIKGLNIENIVIALNNADSWLIKRATHHARENGIKNIKIIPQFSDILSQKIKLESLKDLTIEDLLGRSPVKLDTKEIKKFVENKKILVTGAAGSVGSEICRQLAQFKPSLIVALDFNESGLFDLAEEFKMRYSGQKIEPVIADIRNKKKIERLFKKIKPDAVFHAAAYKHVPLMEEHPEEAFAVNVIGTKVLAEIAAASNVQKFVLISTDKAVNPTSVMGKTKRIAEMIVQALGPKFSSVRFGNVLASRGSVVPLFQEQIKRRAPVTVTHPDMTRYFMTIPEASLLVIEAGAISQGGEIFLLDMGKPVKILDLAKEVIRLSGLEPDKDIPIVFTGVRPGEKIIEELLTAEEGASATKWEKIFIAKNTAISDPKALLTKIERLEKSAIQTKDLQKELDKLLVVRI